MIVHVKLFAIVRELAGAADVTLELASGATVDDARRELARSIPALAPWMERVAFAVNASYAPPQAALSDNDELAIIPPVSGG
jgi:molybdopterin converting factor subunit 1